MNFRLQQYDLANTTWRDIGVDETTLVTLLNDLTDVDTSSTAPTDNSQLKWSDAQQKWVTSNVVLISLMMTDFNWDNTIVWDNTDTWETS